jgi:hypothetical protein
LLPCVLAFATMQIDGLNAKLIEASGALRAKEELREER